MDWTPFVCNWNSDQNFAVDKLGGDLADSPFLLIFSVSILSFSPESVTEPKKEAKGVELRSALSLTSSISGQPLWVKLSP